MSIKNVVVVGANGKIGAFVVDELVKASQFTVTILKRAASSSSSSSYPKSVSVVTVKDLLSTDELKKALSGQDAVVTCIPLKNVDEHIKLAEAAAEAGVKRIIPADFGSADSSSKRAQELVPLFGRKVQVRHRIVELALAHQGFTWTSIVCGHFFDWALKEGFLHVLLQGKKVEMLDGGSVRFSASTLPQIARATVKVLQKPDETKNKVIYIQSFCLSQQDLLESLMRVVGGPWDAEFMHSKDFIQYNKDRADAGDANAVEELVFALGVLEGNWESRQNFANKLLGLEEESLDDVVRKTVEAVVYEATSST